VTGRTHLEALMTALVELEADLERIDAWGADIGRTLLGGRRLLAAGNGGSAAHAQHLTAELVGRYRGERTPLSALALHADTSSATAIANDYSFDEVFARQVQAHGRPGDILLVLSTSGRSANLVAALEAAAAGGLGTLALTGPAPNPLWALADDALCVEAVEAATVQEVHQVVLHLLCEAVEAEVAATTMPRSAA
jgi:D-sedoheptulose 7-phosphate isomerase